MIIREAKEKDIKEIREVARASVKKHFPAFFNSQEVIYLAERVSRPEHAESYLEKGIILIAEDNNQILGLGGIKFAGNCAWFGLGYVLESNQGIGSALMSARLKLCSDLHSANSGSSGWCVAEVWQNNFLALKHLERHGFKDAGLLRPARHLKERELALYARAV